MNKIAEIVYENEQDIFDDTARFIKIADDVVNTVLGQENFSENCEVSLVFTDNEKIRDYNREWRNIDSATDVLSFPQLEYDEDGNFISEELISGAPLLLGDIVISLERASEQAEEFGHSIEREVAFLCAHSTLHLLGYDHEDSEESRKDMRIREERALSSLGLVR